MKSLLTQLERNEMLLMYLAGELPPEDQVQVQRMLEQDQGLRGELEKLQGTLKGVEGALAGEAEVDDISAERAIQQTIGAMRSQRAEAGRERDVAEEGRGWRIPTWAYPVAAAAVVLIALSVYLTNMDQAGRRLVAEGPNGPVLAADLVPTPPGEPVAVDAVEAGEVAEDLAGTFDDSDWVLTEATDRGGLSGATEELRTIQRLSGEPVGLDLVE